MACCCKSSRSNKSSTSCLGRCDLPKHRCMYKDDVKPGPVPRNMGWDYTAQGAPTHQLRCGWRPGHIACPVLRVINQHYCSKGECCRNPCPSVTNPISCCGSLCASPSCCKPCKPSPCKPVCKPHPCKSVCCKPKPSCCPMPDPNLPLIRIVRHNGNYMISTKPSKESNSPSGPYPLKYVLNPSQNDGPSGTPKYCIEAKYNDICFDYTSSQASFVIDFTPPETACYKTCVKKN